MKKRFIETSNFTEQVQTQGPNWDVAYADFQNLLMKNPELGKVIPGCGGLRKVRLADPKRAKGKRGGSRVLYLHVPQADWIFLIDIYDKNEKEDLSSQEKTVWRELAEQLADEAFAAVKELEEDYP